MGKFEYTPDDDAKIHEDGTIALLCKAFQTHENGLPEWAKNAADEYARRDVDPEQRVIVIMLSDGAKRRPPTISCLDFGGMTSAVIEEHFRHWGAPDAAYQGGDADAVQGGHGNGGKCYMTQMFDDHAMVFTVVDGKGCSYGVPAGSSRFGYMPNRQAGRDFEVKDLANELTRALEPTGCKLDALPEAARGALASCTGFTLVTGVKPRDYKKKIPADRLIESLEEHPQMIRTMQLCRVYVTVNGEVANGGKPLDLPTIQPMEGAEKPLVIPVPAHVKDPSLRKRVSTTENGTLPEGRLVLRTSRTSMRWGKGKKTRHSVVFVAESGYVGYVPVRELDIQSAYRDRIYGECHLEALEPYKQNDRGRLAESPLTRGVMRFIAHEIQKYAEAFEIKDKQKRSKKEKGEISKINEALDRWKNKFLHEMVGAMLGGGPGTPPPPSPLPAGTPKRIELSLSCARSGLGVPMRPTLRFFDKDRRRIRPVPFQWVSEDTNVAVVDDELGIVQTFSPGTTMIYAETLDGGLRSNRLPLEVVLIKRIEVAPAELDLATGGRQRLTATCTLADGTVATDVYLIWTEDDKAVARVSAAGMVYGHAPGRTKVIAHDDNTEADKPAMVTVSEGDGAAAGKKGGRGYPRVLVSGGIDPDPETGEPVHFSPEDPPVWQRAQDPERNIWWINSAAPLAHLYLSKDEGYGYDTEAWRMYHVERYIEVITQIVMMYDPQIPSPLRPDEWILQWGAKVAEVQTAAAAELASFIKTGELPKG